MNQTTSRPDISEVEHVVRDAMDDGSLYGLTYLGRDDNAAYYLADMLIDPHPSDEDAVLVNCRVFNYGLQPWYDSTFSKNGISFRVYDAEEFATNRRQMAARFQAMMKYGDDGETMHADLSRDEGEDGGR